MRNVSPSFNKPHARWWVDRFVNAHDLLLPNCAYCQARKKGIFDYKPTDEVKKKCEKQLEGYIKWLRSQKDPNDAVEYIEKKLAKVFRNVSIKPSYTDLMLKFGWQDEINPRDPGDSGDLKPSLPDIGSNSKAESSVTKDFNSPLEAYEDQECGAVGGAPAVNNTNRGKLLSGRSRHSSKIGNSGSGHFL